MSFISRLTAQCSWIFAPFRPFSRASQIPSSSTRVSLPHPISHSFSSRSTRQTLSNRVLSSSASSHSSSNHTAAKAMIVGGLLLTGTLLASTSAQSEAPTAPEGIQWVEGCVKKHPEILWLADADVRKTEEGQASLQGPYSEQLFGQKYVEFDRTLMTIRCLKLVLEGTVEAYRAFTASQPESVRLSWDSFYSLHLQSQRIVQSKWGNLTQKQLEETLEAALVLGDMGKSGKARALFQSYGITAPDHDDFYGEAMKILVEHPELSSTFSALPEAGRQLLARIANSAHYGHITHLEGSPSMFTKLKESGLPSSDPLALDFDLFVHTCDVAGALGHVDNRSSLVYNEQAHRAMQTMERSVRILKDPEKNEQDAYQEYVSVRAEWLGLDSNKGLDRVLARIGAMLRLYTQEEGRILQQAVAQLDPTERERIIAQLDVQAGPQLERTPTYMPAVLVNLSNNPKLGSTKEERLAAALSIGLPALSKVLQQHKEALSKGLAKPEIPLNFNPMAGLAKSSPELFSREFAIDPENHVTLPVPTAQ